MSLVERLGLAALGMTSVVALLAWVYELGPFHAWFLAVSLPGAVVLAAYAGLVYRADPNGERHRIMTVAVVAGVIGTIGYDLFRVPFMILGGYRLLSPIESYGVLLVDGVTSSGLSDFAGWAYHFSNGIGFAVTYAALAASRPWGWGVVWAMALETGTLVTPFADDYALVGKWDVIAIAYAAHVPYGMVLGFMLRDPDHLFVELCRIARAPALVTLSGLVVFLVIWLSPWADERPEGLAAGERAAIVDGRMRPEFVRVDAGECFVLRNLDDAVHRVQQAVDEPVIEPGSASPVCIDGSGVLRLRITGEPYDGGFVIIEKRGSTP